MKTRTVFRCTECGATSPKWLGRCPECEGWSTFVEEFETEERPRGRSFSSPASPIAITEVEASGAARVSSGMPEFDRVLGGGIVAGSVVLLAGEPGIGKSTLMLQVARGLAGTGGEVLIVTGEESPRQLRMRADRIDASFEGILVLPETDVTVVEATIRERLPVAVIVDSIQTLADPDLDSAPGGISQVRDTAARLIAVAKSEGVPIFLIGHITKDGQVAGPRVLEHLVDTVLYFEGEKRHAYRIVRAAKNRFGSVSELGLFEMGDTGLMPVTDPSARLLAERPAGAAGSVVVPTIEGTRPLLVEVQALVSSSFLPSPRRLATGVEYNRVLMVLAILERHAGMRFDSRDVFASVAGGVRVTEPAVDLGLAVAVASAERDVPVGTGLVIIGELGLAGEVRDVGQMDARLAEAASLGFTRALAPAQAKGARGIEVRGVATIADALAALEEG